MLPIADLNLLKEQRSGATALPAPIVVMLLYSYPKWLSWQLEHPGVNEKKLFLTVYKLRLQVTHYEQHIKMVAQWMFS